MSRKNFTTTEVGEIGASAVQELHGAIRGIKNVEYDEESDRVYVEATLIHGHMVPQPVYMAGVSGEKDTVRAGWRKEAF